MARYASCGKYPRACRSHRSTGCDAARVSGATPSSDQKQDLRVVSGPSAAKVFHRVDGVVEVVQQLGSQRRQRRVQRKVGAWPIYSQKKLPKHSKMVNISAALTMASEGSHSTQVPQKYKRCGEERQSDRHSHCLLLRFSSTGATPSALKAATTWNPLPAARDLTHVATATTFPYVFMARTYP